MELALKTRLCRTLRWGAFPETPQEFKGLQLLRLSGVEARIKAGYMAEWSVVLSWDPEKRYQALGVSTQQQAADMITATTRLLGAL